MNNEEKILQMLEEMRAEQAETKTDLAGMKADLAEVKSLAERTAVLLETEYRDKLQLLFDGHDLIKEKLDGMAPKSRMDDLEDEVGFLRSVVKSMSKRLDALEKAQ